MVLMPGGSEGVDVLLEEAGLGGAVGAADEGEWAVGDVREHEVGDGGVVVGELLLGEAGGGVEDLVGMGEADARAAAVALRRMLVAGGLGLEADLGHLALGRWDFAFG